VSGRAGNGRDTIVVTTRENSGDIDLMYPPPVEKKIESQPVNIPVGWLFALSDEAVDYAAKEWKCGKPEAWQRINAAVNAEGLSQSLPLSEFKEWVTTCTV